EIVGVLDFQSERPAVGPGALAIHRQTPDADEKILVAAKPRRRIGEVAAGKPAARSSDRIADRRDRADPRLAPQVLLDAPDRHERVVRNDACLLAGLDHESADVRLADSAADLPA